MKFKGYILFAIIALMLLINVGAVYAVDSNTRQVNTPGAYKQLEIKTSTINSSTGQITLNFINDSVPSTGAICDSWYCGPFAKKYYIEDMEDISYFSIYLPESLDASKKLEMDDLLSDWFFVKDTYFVKNDFDATCLKNRSRLIAKLKEMGITLSSNPSLDIACGTTENIAKTGFLTINNPNSKNKSVGAFYIYILKYKVYKNSYGKVYYEANLKDFWGTDKSNYFGTFLLDGENIFQKPNYFTAMSEINFTGKKPTEYCGNNVIDKGESCDGNLFYICGDSDCNTSEDLENVACSSLNIGQKVNYNSGNLKCSSVCQIDSSDCKEDGLVPTNPIQNQPTVKDITITSSTIKLTPAKASGDGFICDNHTCYTSKATPENISFTITRESGKQANLNIKQITTGMNINSEIINSLKTVNTVSVPTPLVLGNLQYTLNTNTITVSGINASYLLSVGYTNTDAYDYYVFVPADINYANINIYKINNRKLIEFYGGLLPEWIPGITGGVLPPTQTTPTTDCELFDSKLCSFRMVNLSDDISTDGLNCTATGQCVKDSDANLEDTIFVKYNEISVSSNQVVVAEMKNVADKIGMSEEQHAVWFAVIGGESAFNPNTTVGDDGVSWGVGQVNLIAFKNQNEDFMSTQADLIVYINKTNYKITNNSNFISFIELGKTDYKASLVLSAAFFLVSRDKLQENFNKFSISDIDQPNGSINDAINTAFGSFYQYSIGIDLGANNFTKGIPAVGDYYPHAVVDNTNKILDNWSVYASMRKTAYYLYFYENFMSVYYPDYLP
ncbi:MAG: hypothetical protein WCF78_00430 [archaeon]